MHESQNLGSKMTEEMYSLGISLISKYYEDKREADMRVFLTKEIDALNELSPIEVLLGKSPFRQNLHISQERILNESEERRIQRVQEAAKWDSLGPENIKG